MYIFMPASSFKESPWSPEVGLYGSYWGGDIDKESNYPPELFFGVVDPQHGWSICDFYYGLGISAFLYCGRSVRPIFKK